MKIIGVGTDIIEIKRIENALDLKKFIDKLFTEEEKKYFLSRKNNIQTIAGNFAAKEAIVKAIKKGFNGISPLEIEVLRDNNGAPVAKLLKDEYKNINIELSISHTSDYAVAYAIAIQREV